MSPLERIRIIDKIDLQRQIDSIKKTLEEDRLVNHNTEVREDLLRGLEDQLMKLVSEGKK